MAYWEIPPWFLRLFSDGFWINDQFWNDECPREESLTAPAGEMLLKLIIYATEYQPMVREMAWDTSQLFTSNNISSLRHSQWSNASLAPPTEDSVHPVWRISPQFTVGSKSGSADQSTCCLTSISRNLPPRKTVNFLPRSRSCQEQRYSPTVNSHRPFLCPWL